MNHQGAPVGMLACWLLEKSFSVHWKSWVIFCLIKKIFDAELQNSLRQTLTAKANEITLGQ